jgi:hypothetical protein
MFVGILFLLVTHWKPSGGIEEADKVNQLKSRHSTVEAGRPLRLTRRNVGDRGAIV